MHVYFSLRFHHTGYQSESLKWLLRKINLKLNKFICGIFSLTFKVMAMIKKVLSYQLDIPVQDWWRHVKLSTSSA